MFWTSIFELSFKSLVFQPCHYTSELYVVYQKRKKPYKLFFFLISPIEVKDVVYHYV